MADSIESRVFIGTYFLLGFISSYLVTTNGVECFRYPRRNLVDETIFDVMQYGAKADGKTDDSM
ncbi:hypothetical protein OROHE_025666 [Orobanche hederae]